MNNAKIDTRKFQMLKDDGSVPGGIREAILMNKYKSMPPKRLSEVCDASATFAPSVHVECYQILV